MAVITPTPITFNAATLKIGTNNYELSVSAFTLTPTYPETEFRGIGGNVIAGQGNASWTCDLAYPQDFSAATQLAMYLFTNQGQTVVADIVPKAGGPGFRVSVVLKAGPIGGTVDELLAGTVSLKVTNQPISPIPV